METAVLIPSSPAGSRSWLDRAGRKTLWVAAIAFALLSFFSKEILYVLIVSDVGRRDERYLAEAISSVLLGFLLGKFLESAHELRQSMVAQVQVAAELNHHIRNALQVIAFHCREQQMPQQAIEQIRDSVDRVDWALREVLPRKRPLPPSDGGPRMVAWGRGAGAGKAS
jgi:hypothetical protein